MQCPSCKRPLLVVRLLVQESRSFAVRCSRIKSFTSAEELKQRCIPRVGVDVVLAIGCITCGALVMPSSLYFMGVSADGKNVPITIDGESA